MPSRCITCGSKEVFFERLCHHCYLESHPVLEYQKELTVVACIYCQLLSGRDKWTNFYLSDIGKPRLNIWFSSLISREWSFYYKPKSVKICELNIQKDEDNNPSIITGMVSINASPDAFVPLMNILKGFTIHIEWGECTECHSRKMGQYASKIQIRSQKEVDEKQLNAWADEIVFLSESYPLADGKNPLFALNFLKSGIDALFQSRAPASSVGRTFARQHGGIINTTTEFAGFDKSKSREFPRKHVILINLPEFESGDIMIFNNNPVQIDSFKDFKVEFWDFYKKQWRTMPIKSFLDSKPKLLTIKFQEFQIVNFEQEGKIAQIMNTESFETHYIDASDIIEYSQGDILSGMLYNGALLIKQRKA
ncbi:MAG: NMD3-related protein [Candidatus Hermodarchaeota archaeon]